MASVRSCGIRERSSRVDLKSTMAVTTSFRWTSSWMSSGFVTRGCCRHTSRMIRRMRLRCTALPVFFGTAKPARMQCPGPASRSLAMRYTTRTDPEETVLESVAVRSNKGRTSRCRFRWWERGKRWGNLLAWLRVADGQDLASFGAAASQHLATLLVGHPSPETVLVGALASTRLIRSLHDSADFGGNGLPGRGAWRAKLRRPIKIRKHPLRSTLPVDIHKKPE